VDEDVIYSKNRLGLRGDEFPANPEKHIIIFTVGGSTTECKLLSDQNTWTELLKNKLSSTCPQIWINNAGFDGHTTMGHLVLIRDHLVKLKPDYILLLTGANDIELGGYNLQERQVMKKIDFSSFRNFYLSVCNYSKAASLILNLYRYRLSSRKGLIHNESNVNAEVKNIPKEERMKRLNTQNKFLEAYRSRLNQLISLCRANHIKPILLTQPYLGGDCYDPATGKYLGDLRTGDYNTGSQAEVLEKYNDVVRDFSTKGILVIDLAKLIPKNSEYYYDFIHFTNKGSEEVANILYRQLKDSF
jgi:lysophospholipase L1-like esterase